MFLRLGCGQGGLLRRPTHLDARLVGQKPERFGKGKSFHFHEKIEHVATLMAAEAIINPLCRRYGERGRLFLMKRAEPFEVLACLLERDMAADYIGDIDGGAYFFLRAFVERS